MDDDTGEILGAEIESLLLTNKTTVIKAMIVAVFPPRHYKTLTEWQEGIKRVREIGIEDRTSIPDATGDSDEGTE